MPTRRIADALPIAFAPEPPQCTSTDHEPPTMQYFEPGLYEHTCSVCGRVVRFSVNGGSMMLIFNF